MKIYSTGCMTLGDEHVREFFTSKRAMGKAHTLLKRQERKGEIQMVFSPWIFDVAISKKGILQMLNRHFEMGPT